MRYRKFLRGHSAIFLCVLTSALTLILPTLSPSSAKEPTDADRLNRLLFEHPALELTPDTWKIIQTRQKESTARLSGKLLIIAEKGVTRSVTIEESTGFKTADDELVHWVQAKWHFRPEITNLYHLPVYLIPPKPLAAGTRMIGKPLTLTSSEIAQGITIKTQKMMISLELDHGIIRKIDVLNSSGNPKLDAASVRWVKENSVFTKDQTGLYQMPVVFSRKE
jgi:hypothetical protein